MSTLPNINGMSVEENIAYLENCLYRTTCHDVRDHGVTGQFARTTMESAHDVAINVVAYGLAPR